MYNKIAFIIDSKKLSQKLEQCQKITSKTILPLAAEEKNVYNILELPYFSFQNNRRI